MAEQLNPEAVNPSEIEPKSKNVEALNETKDIQTLNDWFSDQKHAEDVGNVADDHAIWVYFGVGGPA